MFQLTILPLDKLKERVATYFFLYARNLPKDN